MTTFEALSDLICVRDIYSPFLAEFDCSRNVEDIWKEWSIELCEDKDPLDQFALVKDKQRVVGWIGYDMLETNKKLVDCVEPIRSDILISNDTSLLDAVQTVCESHSPIYLVLKGDRFIGFLTYNDFFKLPFRMCLFALLIDLEKTMLIVVQTFPRKFLNNLSKNRLDKAKKIYRYRRYSLDEKGDEYASKLIDSTTFADKFKMLKKDATVFTNCPNIRDTNADLAERVRNSIAHPDGDESGLKPIERNDLVKFVQWATQLQAQLIDFTNLDRGDK